MGMKEKLREMREKAEKIASERLPFEKVSPEVQQERYDICLSCEHLFVQTNSCKKCGCFMGVKTWMAQQQCPLKKWRATSGPLAPVEPKID